MVRIGLVNRAVNDLNRREVQLSLTDRGLFTINRLESKSIEMYTQLFENIPEVEIKPITEGFSKMIELLNHGNERTTT